MLYLTNDVLQHLDQAGLRRGIERNRAVAPTSPLKNGMTVEEIIAFFDILEKYCAQASADFSARRAELYGWTD